MLGLAFINHEYVKPLDVTQSSNIKIKTSLIVNVKILILWSTPR
jgi:hypothetical protein